LGVGHYFLIHICARCSARRATDERAGHCTLYGPAMRTADKGARAGTYDSPGCRVGLLIRPGRSTACHE